MGRVVARSHHHDLKAVSIGGRGSGADKQEYSATSVERLFRFTKVPFNTWTVARPTRSTLARGVKTRLFSFGKRLKTYYTWGNRVVKPGLLNHLWIRYVSLKGTNTL